MIGASNLYVYLESVVVEGLGLRVVLSYDKQEERIESLCKDVESVSEMKKVFERIDSARTSSEARLVRALAGDQRGVTATD